MMLDMIGWLCTAPVAAISAVFAIETSLGLLPTRRIVTTAQPDAIAVIMPAHDEAPGIGPIIEALLRDAPAGMRLLVVADNCTDGTAAVARAAGAEVIERDDPNQPGKGHAIAFARDHLVGDPPAVAIVIDADCEIDPGGIARLAAAALDAGVPVQAAYLLKPRPAAAPMVRISGFAFLVKNLVRQRGLAKIGAPAILTGSGMAFPWTIFATAPLAAGDIVEDLSLGIALTERGQAPVFLPDVTIWSDPSSAKGTFEQRRRWEHGFLAARPAAWRSMVSGRWQNAWLGAHLLVPPLALLMIAHFGLLSGLVGLHLAGASWAPLVTEAFLILLILLPVGLAWRSDGRDQVSGMTLLYVPFYLLWKLPLYLTAFTRREHAWIRTERASIDPASEDL